MAKTQQARKVAAVRTGERLAYILGGRHLEARHLEAMLRQLTRYNFAPAMKGTWVQWESIEALLTKV